MLTGISKIPLNYFLERIKQDSTPTISILHALSGCLCLIKAIFQHSPAKEAKLKWKDFEPDAQKQSTVYVVYGL